MVKGAIRHARKDIWVLINNQAVINSINGGGFQFHQQGDLWHSSSKLHPLSKDLQPLHQAIVLLIVSIALPDFV
jgi:hypothetical protein